MNGSSHISLPSIEQPFAWLDGVGELTLQGGGFRLTASPQTDWFINPDTETVIQSAPALVTPAPPDDFVLGAHVHARTAARFDAGVLLAYSDDRRWAKLCLERSPDDELMVVSVVTRDTSDDSNGEVVDGDAAWLRIARVGGAMAFHWSVDGVRWRFVRQFRLGGGDVQVGFLAQSPVGEGSSAIFDRAFLEAKRLSNLRDGT